MSQKLEKWLSKRIKVLDSLQRDKNGKLDLQTNGRWQEANLIMEFIAPERPESEVSK